MELFCLLIVPVTSQISLPARQWNTNRIFLLTADLRGIVTESFYLLISIIFWMLFIMILEALSNLVLISLSGYKSPDLIDIV